MSSPDADEPSGSPVLSSRTFEVLVYLLVLLWAVYLLAQVSPWRRNDKIFPLLFGIPLVALVGLKILSIRRDGLLDRSVSTGEDAGATGSRSEQPEDETEPSGVGEAAFSRAELVAIAWPVVFLASVYLIGFSTTVPIFLFAAVQYHLGDLRWSILVTLAISVPIFLFEFTQGYLVWEGLLFP